MTSTARQLRQPPTIEAIKRVPYFADGKVNPTNILSWRLDYAKGFKNSSKKIVFNAMLPIL